MPIGRYVRGLNSYDLLGNLFPGIVALVVTLGAFATPPIPGNIGEYSLFVVVAFLVGGLIQSVASTAVGSRKHFDWTMSSAEDRTKSELAETKRGPDQGETEENSGQCKIGDGNGWGWKLAHPLIGPFFWWLRPDRGKELDDEILVNRIWEYLIDTHEIPFRTTSYSVLYHVMSSRVDNIQSPSRAVRMQALRNFHRGMWIASWYSSALLIWVFAIDSIFSPHDSIPIVNFTYQRPVFFEYFAATWILIPVALAGVLVFWIQAESSEEDYIEYLFADYVVAVASDAEDISFDDDTTLTVSGQLAADIGGSLDRLEEATDQVSDTTTETDDTDNSENGNDDTDSE